MIAISVFIRITVIVKMKMTSRTSPNFGDLLCTQCFIDWRAEHANCSTAQKIAQETGTELSPAFIQAPYA